MGTNSTLNLIAITTKDLSWMPQSLSWTYSKARDGSRIQHSKETHAITGAPLCELMRLSGEGSGVVWQLILCGDIVGASRTLKGAKRDANVRYSALIDSLIVTQKEETAAAEAARQDRIERTDGLMNEIEALISAGTRTMAGIESVLGVDRVWARSMVSAMAAKGRIKDHWESEERVYTLTAPPAAGPTPATASLLTDGERGLLPAPSPDALYALTDEGRTSSSVEHFGHIREALGSIEPATITHLIHTIAPDMGAFARAAVRSHLKALLSWGMVEVVEAAPVPSDDIIAEVGEALEAVAAILRADREQPAPIATPLPPTAWLLTETEIASLLPPRLLSVDEIAALLPHEPAPLDENHPLLDPVPSVFAATLPTSDHGTLAVLVDRYDGGVWQISDATTHEDVAELQGGSWGMLTMWRHEVDPPAVRELIGHLEDEVRRTRPGALLGYHETELDGSPVQVHLDGGCAYVWRLDDREVRMDLLAVLSVCGGVPVMYDQYDPRINPEAIREAVDEALLEVTP